MATLHDLPVTTPEPRDLLSEGVALGWLPGDIAWIAGLSLVTDESTVP